MASAWTALTRRNGNKRPAEAAVVVAVVGGDANSLAMPRPRALGALGRWLPEPVVLPLLP